MPVHPFSWSIQPSAGPSSVFTACSSALSPPSSSQPLTPVGGGAFSWAAPFQEVASLLLCSGDPLPPSEALLARCCWKSGPGAQECWVSWHVTLGPRCQIPEPWPGQTMPGEGRSWTLMNSARETRPQFHSLPPLTSQGRCHLPFFLSQPGRTLFFPEPLSFAQSLAE